MAVEITKIIKERYRWNTNSQTFAKFRKTWNDSYIVAFNAHAFEQLALSGTVNKVASVDYYEQLYIKHAGYSNSPVLVSNEKIALVDRDFFTKIIFRTLLEDIEVKSILSNRPFKPQSEYLFIADDEYHDIGKWFKDKLTVKEKIDYNITIIRNILESISFNEILQKKRPLNINETIALKDVYIKAHSGVLSDIVLNNKEMSLDEFMQCVETPALYQQFSEFKVGEYEYKDALVRVVLRSSSREMNPNLITCIMNVDIPDTDDRGTVKITNTSAATKVYFNRFYYNPPEVVVTLIGGNTATGTVVPNIISTDLSDEEGRYFEVELLKVDGSRTSGTISWASKGY